MLLIGGYQPLHYLTPRLIDVGIGVVTGLAVNVLVFPPQHERQLSGAAEQARAAARNARESLRWNPRARVERAQFAGRQEGNAAPAPSRPQQASRQ